MSCLQQNNFSFLLQDFGHARRALYTTLVILGSFLVCWLPCVLLSAGLQIHMWQLSQKKVELLQLETYTVLFEAQRWSFTLLVTNSILDPLIYMSNLRLKLQAFCRALVCKLRHPYAAVMTGEGIKEYVPTAKARSSVQMSAICNVTSTEPLYSTSNAC